VQKIKRSSPPPLRIISAFLGLRRVPQAAVTRPRYDDGGYTSPKVPAELIPYGNIHSETKSFAAPETPDKFPFCISGRAIPNPQETHDENRQ
jgi:hypothetical protein